MTQKTTLKELVQSVVEGFLITESPFSVYQITQSVRQAVNSGAVAVPSLAVEGQEFKFDVSHDAVKYYFNELNQLDEFSRSLARSYNGQYFIYQAKSNAVKDVKVNPGVNPLQPIADAFKGITNTLANMKMTNFAQPSIGPSVAKQATTSGKLDRSEVVDRVKLYLRNAKQRNFKPTPRQIQSAIKRHGKSTGWSRRELSQLRDGIQRGTI